MTDMLPGTADDRLSLADSWTVPTRHWHRLDDGRIQCDVCPRACRLHEGQRGLCFVRGRIGDQVVLASYGRSSGFCIDPIEKKPLNHFLLGRRCSPSVPLAATSRASSVRTGTSRNRPRSTPWPTRHRRTHWRRLQRRTAAAAWRSPTTTRRSLEYAVDVADACRRRGIAAVAVTAGYMEPGARRELYAHMDAANVDLKAFTEAFYHRVCSAHLTSVLDTLVYLRHETDVWFEITTLLIPGTNDSNAEIAAETAWIAAELGPDVPLHFTAFHPDYKMRDVPATPAATLGRARRIALDAGLRYVYTGNVRDLEGDTTRCLGCGDPVVVRDWHVIRRYGLDASGHCRQCGAKLPGVYDGAPGEWGRCRLPVVLAQHRR